MASATFRLTASVFTGLFLLSNPAIAADWPHWLGPNYNGSSPEKNLLTDWPAQGPKLLWKVPGGDGYSTVAVVKDRACTLVQRNGKEWIIALNVKNGKEVWQTAIGKAYKNNYGHGPRSTPTIENGRVYVQSVTGTLACLNAADGKEIWRHNILKEFGAKNITWGLSASPVIDGDLLFAIPGAKGAGVVAYNKTNGKLVWKKSNDKAAYASPRVIDVGGAKQVIVFNATGLMAVRPATGKEIWRMPWTTEFDCNICTPLAIGNRIFVSSGEKVGCAMLQLSGSGAPDTVWESRGKNSVMINYWANSVHHKGHLYGLNGEFNKRIDLRCVDAKSGKLIWSQPNFGLSAVTLAAGHLFISTKKGDVVLAQATPDGYKEKARLRGYLGQNRTSPTISNGRLFLRDRANIYCLDISTD